jgi:hypothetical protein
MNLDSLTQEEREALKAQFEQEEQANKAKRERERESYRSMRDEFVQRNFERLRKISDEMLSIKRTVFQDSEALIGMKCELFNVRGKQQSHSFTTADSKYTIKLGYRVNESWDDTVDSGIEKVKAYLQTLAKDEDSAWLIESITSLLSRNQKGELKASRVLELKKIASKKNNPDFDEGIRIIENAYNPQATCQFIEVKYKDEKGVERALPLSMSSIDF